MALIQFTSYDDIRAALGVSPEELEDATLSLPLYDFSLTGELEDISLTLITDFLALPVDSGTWSDDQRRFDAATRLFSTYAVARELTVALPLFAPKEITDGKAATTRFTQDPYRATIDGVNAAYLRASERLAAAYDVIKSITAPAAVSRHYSASVVSTTVDPVTGA
jgi:hypothetical protein